MRIREYIAALWGDWKTSMSSTMSILLMFVAAYFSPPSPVWVVLLWLAAGLSFLIASYRVWAKEQDKRLAVEKQLEIAQKPVFSRVQATTVKELFSKLTPSEIGVLREVVFIGRSRTNLSPVQFQALESVLHKTGFVTRISPGHYEVSKESVAILQSLYEEQQEAWLDLLLNAPSGIREPEAKIEMLQPAIREITVDMLSRKVLAVPFRNNTKESDAIARHVVAHIQFEYLDKGQEFSINYGYWIEETGNRATFRKADTLHVVLVGVGGQECYIYDDKYTDRHGARCRTTLRLLPGEYLAEISLTGDNFHQTYPAIRIQVSETKGVTWAMEKAQP